MLRFKIKSPTGKTLQVSEFAYEKRYKGLGWEIIDTQGKAVGSAKEISVPLPQPGFVPPQVLALHQKESVAVVNDPTGPSEVPDDPEPEASKVEDAKPAKKVGRPKKAK